MYINAYSQRYILENPSSFFSQENSSLNNLKILDLINNHSLL